MRDNTKNLTKANIPIRRTIYVGILHFNPNMKNT